MYFPQLVPDYEAPQAQDWSQYMPAGSPFTGGMRMPRTPDVSGLPVPVGGEETGSWAAMPGSLPGVAMSADPTIPAGYGGSYGPKSANLGGLLYQPWSSDYQQQFVPENIWNYAPPEINRQPVQYTNPLFGPMNIIMPEEEGEGDDDDDDDDYDWASDPEGLKGGKMPGDVGYETSSPFGGKSSGLEGGGQSSNNPADRGYTGGMGPVPR
jgi:hypothetical protein